MSQTTTPQPRRTGQVTPASERTVDPDKKAPFGTGLLKGLAVTVKHLFSTPSTQMYPTVRPDLPARTRGVIALMDENCTVCMLCSRECPDWCIYIDSHKEQVPPAKEGGRARTRNVLDRFAIDFALCMYCGICVEVCPFDALFWSPEFEYSEYSIDGLLHEMDTLREWADTVPPPPLLDDGADAPPEVADAIGKKEQELDAAAAAAEQKALEEQKAEDEATAPAAKADAGPSRPKPTLADMEIEGEPQVDQQVFDELVADGKSERMARSKAKAAWVKAEKKKLLDEAIAEWEAEQESAAAAPAADAGPTRPKPTLADMEIEGEPQVDQQVFDELVADGKSERMARSKAKAAWVKAQKKKLLDEAIAEWEAEQEAAAPVDGGADGGESAAADAEAAAAPAQPKLADVQVEGAGEIDQETYDRLIAEGKSERIARAKAKAAWVKARKQEQLDQEGGE